MKKFLLSFSLIFVFSAYVLYSRQSAMPSVSYNTSPAPTSIIHTPTVVSQTKTPAVSKSARPAAVVASTPVKVVQPAPKGKYVDGTYMGSMEDAYYGYVKVEAVIENGKLADVQFLDHPSERSTSVRINNYAMPNLKSEAISAQTANVNIVSSATYTSMAFRRSLAAALASAQA